MRSWSGRCSCTSSVRVVWSFSPVGSTTSFQTSTLTQKPLASARYLHEARKMRSASGSIVVSAVSLSAKNVAARAKTAAPPVNFRLFIFISLFRPPVLRALVWLSVSSRSFHSLEVVTRLIFTHWNSVMLRLRLAFAEAFFGDGVPAADQGSALAAFGSHERLGMFHGHPTHPHQRERLGGFLAQRVETLLHRGHFVGMRGGDVIFLIGIFGEVVEVHAR